MTSLATVPDAAAAACDLANVRDFATAAPSRIRPGVLFRSSTVSAVTPEDLPFLEAMHTLVDIRGPKERAKDVVNEERKLWKEKQGGFKAVVPGGKMPDVADWKVWVQGDLLSEMRIGIGLAQRASWLALMDAVYFALTGRVEETKKIFTSQMDRGGLALLNEIMLEKSQKDIKAILEMLTVPEAYPAVVFCTVGKDRTGMMVALILGALGLSEEEITADYLKSGAYYDANDERRAELRGMLEVAGMTPELWIATPAHVMQDSFKIINGRYGGLQAYFKLIGFSEESQDKLKQLMLLPEAYAKAKEAEATLEKLSAADVNEVAAAAVAETKAAVAE